MRDTTIDDIKSLTERCERAEREVQRLESEMQGMNADIEQHFEAGWEACNDFHANCGEGIEDAIRMYLDEIDR